MTVDAEVRAPEPSSVARTTLGRLYRGQTAVDFHGHRRIGFIISVVLLVVTVVSLFTRGLNLGIDFEGGVVWDVPGDSFTIDDAEAVLQESGLDPSEARIQVRSSESGEIVKIQVAELPLEQQEAVRASLAEAAGVPLEDVSASAVSSSWGRDVTEQAVRALIVFLVLVSLFISIRFEWRMAVAALVAMAHDVAIAVGIYSVFGFVVTPATVIAFLTILGYSLYDTIVVFDRVRENEAKFAAHKVPYADVVNTSMNQVLMRSINTSLSSIIPVLSLLVVGAWIMGASTLSEFALALLVGMITGVYSSIYVATPLLAVLKERMADWRAPASERARGDELRDLVMGGVPAGRRTAAQRAAATSGAPGASTPGPVSDKAEVLLTHAPRPRKKKRR
ncbi:MAG: protein translocase subunit SecF [Ilumatobacteraceae bacterium]|nr:protein translocase subunit SecF [Ilumatobacteraceae bacterium]